MTNQPNSSEPTAAPPPPRRLVFISHANSEDNDFTRWLGVQLANAGYEVWSDVTKLIGGEIFWDDIEEAIRVHAAKFVLVASRAANEKPGVQDEVAVAIAVERNQKIKQFVVPIRVDDLPFTDFRANITRKNAIDFSKGWSPALASLFEVLERDQVPRGAITAANVKQWCEQRFDPAQQPRKETETLVSNWLPISALPLEVSLFSLGVEEKYVRDVMGASRLPWFPYFRLAGTFGNEIDLRQDLSPDQHIQLHYRLTTESFLHGKAPETPGVTRADARRFVVSMLRQAWDKAMAAKGLLPFEMANGAIAWFFPKGLIEKDTAHFVDHTGKRRRKAMVGRSDKRKVYWHLGFIAKPVLSDAPHFVLKAAIIFSEDGKKPLDSVEKMHRLRRGFCRNWWNGHWRDLMLAYVAWIAEESSTIDLPIGDFSSVTVAATPVAFTSPVACDDPAAKTAAGSTSAEDETDTPPEAPVEPGEEFIDGSDGEGGDDD